MDDLISGLLMLTVAAAIVAVLVAVAIAMVAASAVVGSVIVAAGGVSTFISSLSKRISQRGAAARSPRPPEPAFELYVLGQLSRDIRSAGDDGWAAMKRLKSRADQIAQELNDGPTVPLSIGAIVGGYIGLGIGAALAGLLTLPLLIVAGIVVAGAWSLVAILRFAESIRRRVRRTSYECPVDHERFPLPVYVCPSCGADHRQLVPGRWGIIRRECSCGRVSLPTMVLTGRQRVPQRCPSGHPMAGLIGYTELVRIALVAGPRAGKTTFLAGALHELDELSLSKTLALGVLEESRGSYERALRNLEHGRLPDKTQVGPNPALVAEVQGEGRSRVLSLYDVAGESFVGDDAIRELRFLEVPNGLVLLLDPLALQQIATDRKEEIAAAEDRLRPSPVYPLRVVETMLNALASTGARPDKLPIAVVVGKSDALGIGDEIEQLRASEGDRAVPAWLEQQGAGNLVRTIESSFMNVGWFSASALGRVPDPSDRRAFVPAGTSAPILWLLRRSGVVPAPRPFEPQSTADRLQGATEADFPPVSRAGWTWRLGSGAIGVAAVTAALAVGVASLADSLSDGGSAASEAQAAAVTPPTSDNESDNTVNSGELTEPVEPGADAPQARTFDRDVFRITLPSSWKPGARDIDHGTYVDNRWHPAGDSVTTILVDYTLSITTPAPASARIVRADLRRRNPSYVELDWRASTVAGRPAWRWEFIVNRRHKVDYFVNGCGNGYAVLGSATPGNWSRFRATFERAAQSLELAC